MKSFNPFGSSSDSSEMKQRELERNLAILHENPLIGLKKILSFI